MNSNDTSIEELDPARLPAHVAIIMDGNGRWAKKRLMNRIKGHEKGSEAVRMIVRACRAIGIKYLTLYAFSTENWQRPKTEVSALMKLLKNFMVSERRELLDNNIRLITIGQTKRLPDDVKKALYETMAVTSDNDGMTLNLALSYGARDEITRAVQNISEQVKAGSLALDEINEELVSASLFTKDLPDPDLMIRTSGESRISNFLLWQLAYSEIHITNSMWPEFTKEEFISILCDYQNRDRRFGKIEE